MLNYSYYYQIIIIIYPCLFQIGLEPKLEKFFLAQSRVLGDRNGYFPKKFGKINISQRTENVQTFSERDLVTSPHVGSCFRCVYQYNSIQPQNGENRLDFS